jgi:hypothetical protein
MTLYVVPQLQTDTAGPVPAPGFRLSACRVFLQLLDWAEGRGRFPGYRLKDRWRLALARGANVDGLCSITFERPSAGLSNPDPAGRVTTGLESKRAEIEKYCLCRYAS